MQCQFKYGPETLSLEVPDRNLLWIAEPATLEDLPEPRTAVNAALAAPIGSQPLPALVKSGQKVVLICDDLTRPTPQHIIVPLVLDELNRGGVRDSDVEIIIGLGTHRPMSPTEILQRFGRDVLERVSVTNHDYLDPDGVIALGETSLGFPIEINRKVAQADVRVAIGNVLPHPMAGWSGGAKMLLPGIASARCTASTHYLGSIHADPLTLAGNPQSIVRQQIEEAAQTIGLEFIVNVVTDAHGRLVGCRAGNYLAAHRAAVRLAEQVYCPTIPALADIVLCNAHPADRDFWQGFKPFVYSQLGLRAGGVLILCLYAHEGLCGDAPEHAPTLLEWTTRPEAETLSALDAGLIPDRIAGALCVALARNRTRQTVFCVSHGIADAEITALGFIPASSVAGALARALEFLGAGATVGVMPYAGETLVALPSG
jgi:lactate racemase